MSFKRGYDSKRTWEEWAVQRSRQMAFAIAMLVLLVFLLIFGPKKDGKMPESRLPDGVEKTTRNPI